MLDGHEKRKGLELVDTETSPDTRAVSGRAKRVAIVNSIGREHSKSAIVHRDGQSHFKDSARRSQELNYGRPYLADGSGSLEGFQCAMEDVAGLSRFNR